MATNVVEVILRAKDEASAQFKKLLDEVGPLGAGLAAVAGVAGSVAAAMAASSIEAAHYGEELRAAGLRAGLTTEQISQLKFAADQEEASLGALSAGVKFLSKNWYEAKTNGGEALKNFQALGFTADQIKQGFGGTDKVLEAVADRLAAVDNASDRAALTLKIFGRGGIELVPLLSKGGDAIRQLREEADKAGITISNTAGVLGDEFVDATNKVNAQMAGLRSVIAEQILPSLITLTKQFSDFLAQVIAFTRANPLLVRTLFATSVALAAIAAAAGALLVGLPLLTAGLAALGIELGVVTAAAGPIALAVIGFGLLTAAIIKLRDEANKPFEVKVVTNADEARKQLEALAAARGEAVRRLRDAEKREQTLVSQGVTEAPAGVPIGPKEQKLVEARSDIAEATAEVKKFDESVSKAAEQLNTFEKTGEGAFDKTGESADELGDKIEDLRKRIAQALAPQDIGDLRKALEPDLTLKGIPPLPKLQIDNTKEEEAVAVTVELDRATADLQQTVERAGGSFERVTEQMTRFGLTANSVVSGVIAGFEVFSAQIDPVAQLAVDTAQAVGQFVENITDSFVDLFGEMFRTGQLTFTSIDKLIRNTVAAVFSLAAEIGKAIVRALVLKAVLAIFSPAAAVPAAFVATGGTVVAGTQAAAVRLAPQSSAVLESERRIPRLVAGGTVSVRGRAAEAFSAALGGTGGILRAATGWMQVPGSPQNVDRVPAILAPGEAVLNVVGGRRPGDLLGTLAVLGEDLQAVLKGNAPLGQPQGPVVGVLNVNALDSDSVRNSLRPGGSLTRELQRAAELQR